MTIHWFQGVFARVLRRTTDGTVKTVQASARDTTEVHKDLDRLRFFDGRVVVRFKITMYAEQTLPVQPSCDAHIPSSRPEFRQTCAFITAVFLLVGAVALAPLESHAADFQFVHNDIKYGFITPTFAPPSQLGSFSIVINPLSGLSGNPAAVAAFNRAAAQWAAYICDPVTVTINGDMQDLGDPSIIGQAYTPVYGTAYGTIRNAMVDDEAAETGFVHPIVDYLPSSGLFDVPTPPSGSFILAGISATRANLSALGFTELPPGPDSVITFNSAFSFDYDNSDGVAPGTVDFQTVAAHEIGHALGFSSEVDVVDYYMYYGTGGDSIQLYPRTLDLYRFGASLNNPSDAAQFAAFTRSLRPNVEANTDQIFVMSEAPAEMPMSTGALTGDGRQASHWKDNLGIGLMDPTLGYQETVPISPADRVAMDLIGWHVVPEPHYYAMVFATVSMGTAILLRRRRHG